MRGRPRGVRRGLVGHSIGCSPVDHTEATVRGSGTGQPVRLRGLDAVRLHLTLAAGLTLCAGAFAFELLRALGGHTFSWLYVFEWPIFAAFAIYLWWYLLHGYDRVRRPSRSTAEMPADSAGTKGEGAGKAGTDDQLQAWNRYVRDLQAREEAEAGPE